MALTPEEQNELNELLQAEAQDNHALQGEAYLDKAQPKDGFSLTRTVVNIFRDTAQMAIDNIDDGADWLEQHVPLGGFLFGSDAKNGVIEYTRSDFAARTQGKTIFDTQLPKPEGSDNVGTAEKIVTNVGGFLVPFMGWTKAFRAVEGVAALRALSGAGEISTSARLLASAGRSVLAGTATNFMLGNNPEANLANTLRDTFGFDNAALNALATDPDDGAMEMRVKAAVANLPLDIAGEAIFAGATQLARMYRTMRKGSEAAQDAFAVAKEDIRIQQATERTQAFREENPAPATLAGRDLTAGETATARPANDNALTPEKVTAPPANPKGKSPETPKAKAEDPAVSNIKEERTVTPGVPDATTGTPVSTPAAPVKPRVISSLDDYVKYVQSVVKGLGADHPERIEAIAQKLIEDPYHALGNMGLDPAKLDYSLFDTPEKMQALHDSLASLMDDIAAKTGRTGQRVTNKETLRTARLLATKPDLLGKLQTSTQGLAGKLTAARVIVGQHGHKLLADAEAAIAEVAAGKAGAAYNEFLGTLHRHAVILGTLRGAGSEIGRALQSLQATVPVRTVGRSLAEQAQTALENAQRRAAETASRAAERAAAKDAKVAAKQATRDAKKVDISSPEAIEFLTDLTNHSVNEDALSALMARHGIERNEVVKQLGVKPGDVQKMVDAVATYDDLFKDIATDAGRLRMLTKLRDAKGDLSKLTRIAKNRNMSYLQRVDATLGELRGNLFSPASAIWNTVSASAVLGLRNLEWATAGLAQAALSPLSRTAAEGARINLLKSWASTHAIAGGFGVAMRNTLKYVKADAYEEASRLFDTAGFQNVARKMQTLSAEASAGTNQNLRREWNGREVVIQVSPETIRNVMDQVDQWPIGRFGQAGLEWMLRAGGTAVNLVGAATRMSSSVYVGAADQLAGTVAARVGSHVAAVEQAAEEAGRYGFQGAELANYIKHRAFELADGLDGISHDPYASGYKEVLEQQGQEFAERALFQDNLETATARAFAQIGQVPILGSLIAPFIKTPLRIMEQTLIDSTPLGLLKSSVREAWASGSPALRGEIAARYTLATGLLVTAYNLAESRIVVGDDGGWKSSARLERQSYTIKIGGDYIEFNRADPVGTLLGLGADLHAVISHSTPETVGDAAGTAFEAAVWPIFKNIMGKTWMQGLAPLIDITTESDPDRVGDIMNKWLAQQPARFVPAGGTARQVSRWDDGEVHAARGVMEGLIRNATGGSGILPVQRDQLLGRPVERSLGAQISGVNAGPGSDDPLIHELARLSFNIQPLSSKLKGVQLNSTQFNRLLELRGQVVTAGGSGTMEDTLRQVVADPQYARATDQQKLEVIHRVMEPYTAAAKQALQQEDPELAFGVFRQAYRDQYARQGLSRDDADREAEQQARFFGMPAVAKAEGE